MVWLRPTHHCLVSWRLAFSNQEAVSFRLGRLVRQAACKIGFDEHLQRPKWLDIALNPCESQ